MELDQVLENFTKNVKEIMKIRDISNNELAQMSDMHAQALSQYLNGKINLSLKIILKISKGLKIPPHDLIAPPLNHDEDVAKFNSIMAKSSKLLKDMKADLADLDAITEIISVPPGMNKNLARKILETFSMMSPSEKHVILSALGITKESLEGMDIDDSSLAISSELVDTSKNDSQS